jgi:hypothetical protein
LINLSLDLFERRAWIGSRSFLVIGAATILLEVPQRWQHGFGYPGNALPFSPIVPRVP